MKSRKLYDGLTVINDSNAVQCEKTVVIFGAGRGGTSAISGCLRELGVQMPGAHPLKHEWDPIPNDIKSDQKKIENVISEYNKKYPVWGWKNPKDLFRYDELLPKLRNPHVIIVFRNPIEIGKSINKREGLPIVIGLSETMAVYQEISRFLLSPIYPAAVISYEEMISNSESVVKSLNQWLNITENETFISNAVNFISKGGDYKKYSGAEEQASFSAEELLSDQMSSWISQYPKHISLLAQSCAAVERSVVSAIDQVGHLKDSLYELCKNRSCQIGLNIDQSVIYEMHDMDYSDFCNILRIDHFENADSGFDNTEKTADLDVNSLGIDQEIYARILPNSYNKLKERLKNISDQRKALQLRMDDLSKKREALCSRPISNTN